MATYPSGPDASTEPCPSCGRDTVHNVRVEIRTESEKAENAQFSREPYRVSVCSGCGTETAMRMNNV